jgi:preprotein translocase subunit SecG
MKPRTRSAKQELNVTTFETVLMIFLVVDALAMGGLVLIQQGKGADVGAAFGAGSSNTMFGSSGSTSFLVKATSWLAVGFFVVSFALAYAAKERATLLRDDGLPGIGAGIPEAVEPGVPEGLPLDEPLTGSEEAVDSEIPDV